MDKKLRKEVVLWRSLGISRTHLIVLIGALILYFTYSIFRNENNHNISYPAPKRNPSLQISDSPTPCGMPLQNDPIIKADGLKAYLVGSYIEHREDAKMIKMITIVLRSENAEYHCLLCCNGKHFSVPASRTIHTDHFYYDYGTADITCYIPEQCTTPTHVAITSHSTQPNEALKNLTFQPIRNQIQIQRDFPFNFTVCIPVMYEYSNVLQLTQSLEMFRILGVQRVAIYKTSCDDDVQKVLNFYIKQNFVELIPWNISHYIKMSRGWIKSVSPGELHYFGQIPALNDCVYRYMYQSEYVSLQDIDELILPINVKTWTELLPELEKQYGQKAEYQFENNVFPVSITETNQISPDSWNSVKGENILNHLYRVNNAGREHENYKMIINPRLVFMTTVHGLLYPANNAAGVSSKLAKIYHIKKAPREFVSSNSHIQDTHIRDFADRLIPAVSEVLQQALGIH